MLRMIACVLAASALVSVGSQAQADGGLFGLPTPAVSVNIAAPVPAPNLLAGGPGCGHHRGAGNYHGSFYRGGYRGGYGGGYYNNFYPRSAMADIEPTMAAGTTVATVATPPATVATPSITNPAAAESVA